MDMDDTDFDQLSKDFADLNMRVGALELQVIENDRRVAALEECIETIIAEQRGGKDGK